METLNGIKFQYYFGYILKLSDMCMCLWLWSKWT
ncbi:hypothetical protein SLEP1_g26236 [Rubroshorea leprosula]|uniref:Uncharacterized protein n=1 Tax=Rubroshorea leprosula TaxID=152421 RepID=A0AAV5JYV1_9ROSI|nr:hypothetical protein SLEP1_g26236 [Rubroshorea leprosula]